MVSTRSGSTQKSRKLVVVGDGMAGKTCLLYAFKDDQFDPDHVPTIFDTYAAEIEVNGKRIELALFDTAGQEDFDRLRPLSYPDTDVVLMCFSVDNPVSVASVTQKWVPEIRHFCGRCPIILVACKKDLRNDPQVIEKLRLTNEIPVSSETGKKLADAIKANAYMECSAKTREGVHELFVHAAYLAMKKKTQSSSRRICNLF